MKEISEFHEKVLPSQTATFKFLCDKLNIYPSRRQWNKFANQEGTVYNYFKEREKKDEKGY